MGHTVPSISSKGNFLSMSVLFPTMTVGREGKVENIKSLSQDTSSKDEGSSTLKTNTTPSAALRETSAMAGNSWTKFWPVSSMFSTQGDPPRSTSPGAISSKLYRASVCDIKI